MSGADPTSAETVGSGSPRRRAVSRTPNAVTKILAPESAGFASVELGYGEQKLARENKKGEKTPRGRRANKAVVGHAAKAGLSTAPRVLKSFRLDDGPTSAEVPTYNLGDKITVDIFAPGDQVKDTGTSKGRGFQGVVKRFRVGGGPASHGSMFHRRIGSIGMRQTPGRSWKNQRMPGHMGTDMRTVQNLRVVKIIADKNLLLVKGAIPGANGDDVIIRSGKKAKPAKKA